MPRINMNSGFSEEDWLNKLERKSNSTRTRITAKASLKTFDLFCKNQKVSRDEIIQQYQIWFNPKPNPDEIVRPDIESICLSLDRFVDFMTKEHDIDGQLCKKKMNLILNSVTNVAQNLMMVVKNVAMLIQKILNFAMVVEQV